MSQILASACLFHVSYIIQGSQKHIQNFLLNQMCSFLYDASSKAYVNSFVMLFYQHFQNDFFPVEIQIPF